MDLLPIPPVPAAELYVDVASIIEQPELAIRRTSVLMWLWSDDRPRPWAVFPASRGNHREERIWVGTERIWRAHAAPEDPSEHDVSPELHALRPRALAKSLASISIPFGMPPVRQFRLPPRRLVRPRLYVRT